MIALLSAPASISSLCSVSQSLIGLVIDLPFVLAGVLDRHDTIVRKR